MLTEPKSCFACMLKSRSKRLPLALFSIPLLFVFPASLHSQEGAMGTRGPIPFPSDSAPMGPVSREAVSDAAFERDVRTMEARSRLSEMQDTRHKFQSD